MFGLRQDARRSGADRIRHRTLESSLAVHLHTYTIPILKSCSRLIHFRPQFDIYSNSCRIPRNELHQHDRTSRTLGKDRGAGQSGQQSPDANGTARSCRRTAASGQTTHLGYPNRFICTREDKIIQCSPYADVFSLPSSWRHWTKPSLRLLSRPSLRSSIAQLAMYVQTHPWPSSFKPGRI